jgi:hypothetical protein
MKHDSKYYIGRDSKGVFKWNEKELIYIEESEIKNKKSTNNGKRNASTK